ncbi:MAG: hypothetical protein ACRES7_04125 [Gammaproteobacteria bacterium]
MVFSAALAVAAATGAAPGAPPIFQPHGMDQLSWEDEATVHRVLDDLFRACPAMNRYLPEITWSSIQIMNSDQMMIQAFPFIAQHHWPKFVSLDITVKIAGAAAHFPRLSHGDTLMFEFLMGGGDDPGIYIADDRSVVDAACGAKNVEEIPTPAIPEANIPADTDYFISVPDMKVIDKLQ